MPRRIIDISIALDPSVKADPPQMHPEIDYHSHADTAPMMAAYFPGLTRDDLPGGDGWAVETVRLSTHNGTHLDAPYHHHSTMNGGERAITIDEMPLEWCFNPGVKLDFRHLPDGHVVSAAEVEAELARIGHDLGTAYQFLDDLDDAHDSRANSASEAGVATTGSLARRTLQQAATAAEGLGAGTLATFCMGFLEGRA